MVLIFPFNLKLPFQTFTFLHFGLLRISVPYHISQAFTRYVYASTYLHMTVYKPFGILGCDLMKNRE